MCDDLTPRCCSKEVRVTRPARAVRDFEISNHDWGMNRYNWPIGADEDL